MLNGKQERDSQEKALTHITYVYKQECTPASWHSGSQKGK